MKRNAKKSVSDDIHNHRLLIYKLEQGQCHVDSIAVSLFVNRETAMLSSVMGTLQSGHSG